MSVADLDLDFAALKAYFDGSLRCGDRQVAAEQLTTEWATENGCGATDWGIHRIFFHPKPGNLFELICNQCKRKRGVSIPEGAMR